MTSRVASREPPANQSAAAWRRTATLAIAWLIGSLLGGCITVSQPSPAVTASPSFAVDAAALVDELPEPAEVADCTQLTTTARSYLHAVAAVATDVTANGPIGKLTALGDGYAARMAELGCDEQTIVNGAQNLAVPAQGASLAEIVEFLLSATEVGYPTHNQPAVVTTDGEP